MDIKIDISNVELETDRLILRPFEASDLDDLYAYASIPGVGEMAGWAHHESIETSKEILQAFIEGKEVFALFHKADQKVIGSLGVHSHSWTYEDEAYKHLKAKTIGYVLSKDYWGQGLVPEAVKAVLVYGFTTWSLEAFGICHFVENVQSRRVIEKCGFKFVKQGKYHAKQLDKYFDDMQYMMLRSDANLLDLYYSRGKEDGRLASRHGQVEFLTTMRYIEKYMMSGAKVIEIGAGTGRYSRHIADMGYPVEAVELIQHNIDTFKSNLKPGQDINITQGNALDLSGFADDTFDITLHLGPMYHLFTEADKRQAISEALRVTKPGGVVFVAYCLIDASYVQSGFNRKSYDIVEFFKKGKIDPVTFDAISVPEDIFSPIRKEHIDSLMACFDVERLHYVATDLLTHYIGEAIDEMDDELYDLYLRYHFAVCERADMVGVSNHILDVFRKGLS